MKEQHNPQLTERLEQLLLEKVYTDLSADELQYVNQHLTPQQYAIFRQTLLSSKQLFQEEIPELDPMIANRLKGQFKMMNTNRPQSKVIALANSPVALWKAIATTAAIALMMWFVPNFNVTETAPQIVYQYKTDTVFKEIPVPVQVSDTQYIAVVEKADKKVAKRTINRSPRLQSSSIRLQSDATEKSDTISRQSPAFDTGSERLATLDSSDFIQVINQNLPTRRTGRSVAADKELMDMIVEIY